VKISNSSQLDIWVKTGSNHEKIQIESQRVNVFIKEKPIDGKANKYLIEFLAKALSVAKSDVIMVRGSKSRAKSFKITGLSQNKLNEILISKFTN
jgi:uncharacterized protein